MTNPLFDVIVVGGGPAGLSAAVALGRARRSVAVVDAGEPRNAAAHAVHNFLTRDGTTPAELRRLGRAEAESYGVRLIDARADDVERTDAGFAVTIATGETVAGRRLLVTTGLVDDLPEIDGVRERWGTDVLHCPYCHGWEVRDRAIGVLATAPWAAHQALLFRQWSDDITLLLNDRFEPSAEQRELFAARGITVVDGRVESLVVEHDALAGVTLEGGAVQPVQALVVGPSAGVRAGLLVQLGLELTEHPMGMGMHVATDPTGATSLPGIWAAGNVTNLAAQVITSAAEGLWAAAQINANLIADDEQAALREFRTGRPGATRAL